MQVTNKGREMEEKHSHSSFSLLSNEEEEKAICCLVGWLCDGRPSQMHDQAPEEPENLPDISEDGVWKYAVNANAVSMMAVAVVLWGYYV